MERIPTEPSDISKSFSKRWSRAFAEGRLDDAVRLSAAAYLLSTEVGDSHLVRRSLVCLAVASRKILGHKNQSAERPVNVCSFCGQTKSSSEIVAGAAATICSSCTEFVARHFVAAESPAGHGDKT